MSGTTLAVLSALSFSINRIFIRRGVIGVSDPSIGALINVPLSLPLLLLILTAMGRVGDIISFPWQSYVWLSLAGIIHFVAGRILNYTAIQLLGANISSVLNRVAPIVAATIGITILSEPLTWQLGVGVLLIACGMGVVTWSPKTKHHHSIPRLSTKGILCGLGTGLLFGVSPIFIKMGASDSCSPIAASFISYCAASVILSLFLVNRGKRTALFDIGSKVFLFFYLAGIFTTVAQTLRYTALSIAPVSVVSPLISISPVFLLGLSFVFNRKIELFSPLLIIGVVITVAGAILVA